jgi:hypothetical protein
MKPSQEIELNRRIERYRSAVTSNILNKSSKSAQAVSEAHSQLIQFVMEWVK